MLEARRFGNRFFKMCGEEKACIVHDDYHYVEHKCFRKMLLVLVNSGQ